MLLCLGVFGQHLRKDPFCQKRYPKAVHQIRRLADKAVAYVLDRLHCPGSVGFLAGAALLQKRLVVVAAPRCDNKMKVPCDELLESYSKDACVPPVVRGWVALGG